MLLIDFIITVFCKIDDMLKKILKGQRLRKRGPMPKLSDSEVISMEIVGEFFNIDKDEDIHLYFRTHFLDLFPNIPDRSVFVRQSANLWVIKDKIRQEILKTLLIQNKQPLRIVDGFRFIRKKCEGNIVKQ